MPPSSAEGAIVVEGLSKVFRQKAAVDHISFRVAAGRLFARIGVVGTFSMLPAVYVLGFGLWVASFGLVTATLFRGAQWVAVNALGGTAWSSLFNVIPGRRRSQVARGSARLRKSARANGFECTACD